MSQKKRIVLLDTGKEWGGGTNSMLELLKRIDRDRFEITCVFYNDYRKGDGASVGEELSRLGIGFIHLPRPVQSGAIKLLKEIVRVLLFFSRRTRRLGIFLVDYVFRIRPDSQAVSDLLRQLHADLLYMNNQPSSNLEGILAANSVGIPVIQHCRSNAMLNRFEVRLANTGLHRIVCVSHGVRQQLVDQGIENEKCVVVHNGIDLTTVPNRPQDVIRKGLGMGVEPLVVTVGSLLRRKRIADLIRVIAVLKRQRGFAVRCAVVGDGPERARLLALAESLGVADQVVFTGFQSDAISYIGACDIFALPSEGEGLPRVVLEAMLMGKPVVASRVVGTMELVQEGETGFLPPLGDIGAWADVLARVIGDADLRERLGRAGRSRVMSDFSITRYITGVTKVLDEVLASCSR